MVSSTSPAEAGAKLTTISQVAPGLILVAQVPPSPGYAPPPLNSKIKPKPVSVIPIALKSPELVIWKVWSVIPPSAISP